MRDHEVNVQRQTGLLPRGRNEGGTEGNVIYEMAIHDVEMEPVGAGVFSAPNLVR